jgi:hypothetical protein
LDAAEAEVKDVGAAETEMLDREEVEAKDFGAAASVGLATAEATGIIVRSVNLLD